MITTLIIGAKGRGKSTAAKKLLAKAKNEGMRQIIVFDPNREYTEFYNKPFVSDRKAFLNSVKDEKNKFMLFEEATIFFKGNNQSDELTDLLVRARHTNNEIVFCFHSLRSVPTYILELVNFVVLFKTSERADYLYKKFEGFPEIIEAYETLEKTPDDNRLNFHKHFIIELNKPVSFL